MNIFLVILIAVGLSMDAFSLSLAYGTLGMENRDKYLLSFITGMFHFIMPLLGLIVGNIMFKYININPDIIVCVILSFIGIQMVISSFKEDEEVKLMRVSEYFLFAFAVSIDSFSVGITLTDTGHIILAPFIFALTSSFFTLIGLSLGNKIERLLGKISTIIGGSILVIVGICYII